MSGFPHLILPAEAAMWQGLPPENAPLGWCRAGPSGVVGIADDVAGRRMTPRGQSASAAPPNANHTATRRAGTPLLRAGGMMHLDANARAVLCCPAGFSPCRRFPQAVAGPAGYRPLGPARRQGKCELASREASHWMTS